MFLDLWLVNNSWCLSWMMVAKATSNMIGWINYIRQCVEWCYRVCSLYPYVCAFISCYICKSQGWVTYPLSTQFLFTIIICIYHVIIVFKTMHSPKITTCLISDSSYVTASKRLFENGICCTLSMLDNNVGTVYLPRWDQSSIFCHKHGTLIKN